MILDVLKLELSRAMRANEFGHANAIASTLSELQDEPIDGDLTDEAIDCFEVWGVDG